MNGKLATLFDGAGMERWVYDPAIWTVRDNAMTGSGAWCMAYTRENYGSFRLLVSTRILEPYNYTKSDHQGLIFWGGRPELHKYDPAGGLNAQPPYGSIWDYRSNTNITDLTWLVTKDDYKLNWMEWHESELLADIKTGDIRFAVDGVEIVRYTLPDPSSRKPGPIGVQIHNGTSVVQYKDIYIESNPEDFGLITVKP